MSRKIIFDSLYYYHIYNRGVDKRQTFYDKWDYVRFLESLKYFNNINSVGFYRKYLIEKDVKNTCSASSLLAEQVNQQHIDLIAYCLNPNHFHLLVRQISENGISEFMHKVGGGYTRYFNEKYKRSGALFQGKFKAKPIKSTYDLMKVSVYVNCNAEIHGIAKAENWPWSGYLDYIGLRKGTLCNKQEVLDEFTSVESPLQPARYKEYCREWVRDIRKIKYLMKFDLE